MASIPLLLSLWVKFLGDSLPGFALDSLRPDSVAFVALDYWARRGFPLAEVKLVGVAGDTAYFSVKKGPLVVVSEVRAPGMPGRLKGRFLGKPFSPKEVEELRSLAEALGLGSLEVRGFSRAEEGFALLLKGPEPKGWATGGAGWSEDGLFGFMDLAFKNLGLWGREARLLWERQDEARGNLLGEITEPFLFGSALWLKAEGGVLYAESLHVKREARVLLGVRRPSWGLWAGQGWEASAQPGSSAVRWPAEVRLESRGKLETEAQLRLWKDYLRAEARAQMLLGVKFLRVRFGCRGGEVRGGLSGDMFWLGGAEPPRGFRPGSIGAARFWVAWAQVGLEKPLSPLAFIERFWMPQAEGWTPGVGLEAAGAAARLSLFYARGLIHVKLSLAL